MKKYLISALAVLALSACGSDGPSEAELKLKEDLKTLQVSWSRQSDTVRRNLCAMVKRESGMAVVELLRKEGLKVGIESDISKTQEAAFYEAYCILES